MQLNETMMRARNLLLELLLFLSIGESCWHSINGGADEYSLARRLGFFRKDEYYAFLVGTGLASYTYVVNPVTNESEKSEKIQINKDEWDDLITEHKSKLEVQATRVDWKNAMNGDKQERDERIRIYAIRIGERRTTEIGEDEEDQIGWSQKNFGMQLKKRSAGVHKPPPVPKQLSSRQRTFIYSIRNLCTDTISADIDFWANKFVTRPSDDTDDNDEDDDDAMECQEQQLNDDCSEPPEKKAKPTTVVHSLKCREDGIVGEDEAAEFLSKLDPKVFQLQRLCVGTYRIHH